MEKLITQTQANQYSISRKPFYKWLSKNFPNFRDIDVLEIDSVNYELWESLYKNFTQSNITISSPVQARLSHIKHKLKDYQIDYQVEHSYRLSYPDDSLDLVISNNNNFTDNIKTIKEVNRVLRNGGILLNLVNGNDHIIQLKNLFYEGKNMDRKQKDSHCISKCNTILKNEFTGVSYRDYKRTIHVTNANDILGYYLSNRNPRVRKWALEDSCWILDEVHKIIDREGSFNVDINLGMFVCTIK